MKILEKKISLIELKEMAANIFGDLVKAVVDIEKKIIALDADLHADLEKMLLEQGSQQTNLWGINLYPDLTDDDFIEFDSMINIRPKDGNRSRSVDSYKKQQLIRNIVAKWVE